MSDNTAVAAARMTYDDGVDDPRSDMMKERDRIRGIVGVASPAWGQFPGLLDRVTDAVAQAIDAHTAAALKEKEECAANASAKDTTEQDVSDGGSDTAVIADLRARLAAAEEERDAHWRELVRINEERNRFRDERDALTAERDRLKEQLLRVGKGRNDAERERDALKAAVEQARESARRQVESVLMLHYGAVHACAVEDLVEILGGNST